MDYSICFICAQLFFNIFIIYRICDLEDSTFAALISLKKYIDLHRRGRGIDDEMCIDAEEYMKEMLKKYKE